MTNTATHHGEAIITANQPRESVAITPRAKTIKYIVAIQLATKYLGAPIEEEIHEGFVATPQRYKGSQDSDVDIIGNQT